MNRRKQISTLSILLLCIFCVGMILTQFPQSVNAASNDFTVDATYLYSQPDLQYKNVNTTNPHSVQFTLNNATSLWISVTTTASGAIVKLNPLKGDFLGNLAAQQGLIPPHTIDPTHKLMYTALFTAANQSVQAAATPYGLAEKLTIITASLQVLSKFAGVDLLPIIFHARSGNLIGMLIAIGKLPSFVKFMVDFNSYIKTNEVSNALKCIADMINMIKDANKMKAFDAALAAGVGEVIEKEVVTPLLKALPLIKLLTTLIDLHTYVPLFYAYVRPFQGQFVPAQPTILQLKSVKKATPTPIPTHMATPTPTPTQTATPTPAPPLNLMVSPGTFLATNDYEYDFGFLPNGASATQNFTLTNLSTTATVPLSVGENTSGGPYILQNGCINISLAANGGSCTFTFQITTPQRCPYGTATVFVDIQDPSVSDPSVSNLLLSDFLAVQAKCPL